jgi:O-glycosyl hydrolase
MEQPAWLEPFLTDKQATKKLAIIGLHLAETEI